MLEFMHSSHSVSRASSMRSQKLSVKCIKIENLCMQIAAKLRVVHRSRGPIRGCHRKLSSHYSRVQSASSALFVTVHLHTNDDTVWELVPVACSRSRCEAAHRNQQTAKMRNICVPSPRVKAV